VDAPTLCQNIIPSFGIVFVFVFVLSAQAQEAYMFPLVDSTPELTLWCGDVVWCVM
jgi:hypothetical protein